MRARLLLQFVWLCVERQFGAHSSATTAGQIPNGAFAFGDARGRRRRRCVRAVLVQSNALVQYVIKCSRGTRVLLHIPMVASAFLSMLRGGCCSLCAAVCIGVVCTVGTDMTVYST